VSDDVIEIALRPPAEVARRAIVIASLLRRLWIESLATKGNEAELAGECFDIRAWLQTEGIWDSLSPLEVGYLEAPAGSLSDDACAAIAWQTEALATLAWALRQVERLSSSYLDDVTAAIGTVPCPWDTTALWIARASLRPEAEIARERDRAEILDWRIGIEVPRRLVSGDALAEIEEAIAAVAREAEAAGVLSDAADGDFPIGGQRLETVDPEGLGRLTALGEERLRALNWLCGFGVNWEDVPLDV
jgi:hypothetical protein